MQVVAPGLMQSLAEGTPLIAATPFLATIATHAFSQFQLAKNAAGWQRPAMYSVDAWLTSCWREVRYGSGEVPMLLSPAQELMVWENAIQTQGGSNPLFDTGSAARLAVRTSRLAAEWHVDENDGAWEEHADGHQFQAWARSVDATCRSRGWMTRADLWQAIPKWMKAGACPRPALSTLGFGRLSPGMEALLDGLPSVRHFGSPSVRPASSFEASFKAFETLEGELTAAARWSRLRFENKRKLSFGVFVPQLAANRSLVERLFNRVFYPAPNVPGLDGRMQRPHAVSPFHIHAARPLWEEPLVADALLLLDLTNDRIDIADAAAILRSPFIKGALRERDDRAMADLALRRLRELDVDNGQMLFVCSRCPELHAALTQVRNLIGNKPEKAETAQWSSFFADLLRTLGWPGDREGTAEDQALVETWKDALSELGSLSLVMPPLTLQAALGQLRRLLGRNRTEIGDWFSPIQILDAGDAEGLSFDGVFLVGMGDDSWPPPRSAAPLIPLRLQRLHGLPESTPDLMQADRRRGTTALLESAPDVQIAYRKRLSPLFSGVRQSERVWAEWAGKTPLQAFRPMKKDSLEDTYAPPLGERGAVRGGTSIIKLQSACPFRAFAEVRLASRTPENACFGMDARERGSFLHQTLQYVWEELRDSRTLKKLAEDRVREVVARCVHRALEQPYESEFRRETAEVERTRLTDLICDWLLRVEKARKMEWTVENTETALDFSLAGLPMKLRIDRVDRLANGQLLLIDYKSGKVTRSKLEGERPEEPQLLVYAAAKRAEVDGVFFGQLRRDDSKMTGISREHHVDRRVSKVLGSKWEDQLAEWDSIVEGLAADFMKGRAAIDPAPCACDYCENKPLCRIREKTDGNVAEKAGA